MDKIQLIEVYIAEMLASIFSKRIAAYLSVKPVY